MLTFQRISTITLFTLCCILAFGNLIFLYTKRDRKRGASKFKSSFGNFKNFLEIANNVIFIIHSLSGIKVAVDLSQGIFDASTVSLLVISCACSLLYAGFMSYSLSLKLQVMDFRFGKLIFLVFVACEAALKVTSFIIVFYILFSNWGAENLLAGFLTPLGYAGSYLNLTGNQIYTDFIALTTLLYARFIYLYLQHHQTVASRKSEANQPSSSEAQSDQQRSVMPERSIKRYTLILIIAALLICCFALILSILAFQVIQHAAAIALNSFVSAVLSSLNIWLDDSVLRVKSKISGQKESRRRPDPPPESVISQSDFSGPAVPSIYSKSFECSEI